MEKRIIYQSDDNGVSIIIPSPEYVAIFGIEKIAQKDVPAGRPYKIVDATEIPEDRTFRAAWHIDASYLTDGIGDDSDSITQEVA